MISSRTFLGLLKKREEILAKFYSLFATIIVDDAVFWRMLAEGKSERIKMLEPYVEQSEAGSITCTISDRSYEDLASFIDELNTLRSLCSMHYEKLTKKTMIQLTLYLEHVSAKQAEIPLSKLDSAEVHKVLQQISYELELGLETIDEFAHNYRIFSNAIPQTLKEYRRILQPVSMIPSALEDEPEELQQVEKEEPLETTNKRFVRPKKMSAPMSEFFVEKKAEELPPITVDNDDDDNDDDTPDDVESLYEDLKIKFGSLQRENEYLRTEIEALRKIHRS